MPYIGQLGAFALGKESVLGTAVTPTTFIPFIPPLSVSTEIDLLESAGVRGIPDLVYKAAQGPGALKSGKAKFEVEPENIGEHLNSIFGTDTSAETASFIVSSGVNDKIDFKESGGSQIHATLAAGTYAISTTSATVGSLCKAIKTAMDAAAGAIHTYTITYSYSTRKITITPNAGTLQILWLTGTNTATNAHTLMGFSNVDTSDAATQTSDSTTQIAAFTHTFTRVASATPPSYTLWVKNGLNFPQFAGCLLSKLEITAKSKEFVVADADWMGLNYDSTGITQTLSYSTYQPFKFNQVVMTVGGSQINNYDNFKLTLDNMVELEWVLGTTVYAKKIVSKGFKVTLAAEVIVEDTTEWAKFIAGTSTSFTVTITSSETLSGSTTAFSLTFSIPTAYYNAAPWPLANGLIKIPFTATGVYTVASTKTASAALLNTVATAY